MRGKKTNWGNINTKSMIRHFSSIASSEDSSINYSTELTNAHNTLDLALKEYTNTSSMSMKILDN